MYGSKETRNREAVGLGVKRIGKSEGLAVVLADGEVGSTMFIVSSFSKTSGGAFEDLLVDSSQCHS